MKFVIESTVRTSGRLGFLTNIERLPGKIFETPMLLLSTKGGSLPFLSKDVLETLPGPHAVQINVSNTEMMEDSLKIFKNGIAEFGGLKDCLTFVSLKDPSESVPTGYHEKGCVPVFTKSGKILITEERYMNLMEVFKPDMYHNLCDGDASQDISKKRVIKSVERSEGFLKYCVNRHKNSKVLCNSMMFASLEGGYLLKEREKMINNISEELESFAGYFFDGFHINGQNAISIKPKTISEVVSSSIKILPTDKLRVMLGAYSPATVLELISVGIDMFDSSIAYIFTKNNCAITFNFDVTMPANEASLDLSNSKYKEDFTPILNECKCLTCVNHTKAYVNHLINTKELLASILLMVHNLHHYLEFFQTIRKTIDREQLDQLKALIDNYSFEDHLPVEVKIEDKKHQLMKKTNSKPRLLENL